MPPVFIRLITAKGLTDAELKKNLSELKLKVSTGVRAGCWNSVSD
jgi:hypothetical protein